MDFGWSGRLANVYEHVKEGCRGSKRVLACRISTFFVPMEISHCQKSLFPSLEWNKIWLFDWAYVFMGVSGGIAVSRPLFNVWNGYFYNKTALCESAQRTRTVAIPYLQFQSLSILPWPPSFYFFICESSFEQNIPFRRTTICQSDFHLRIGRLPGVAPPSILYDNPFPHQYWEDYLL